MPLSLRAREPRPAADVVPRGRRSARRRQGIYARAIVIASAALRGGGVVYTADVKDLTRLARHFPTVRVLSI